MTSRGQKIHPQTAGYFGDMYEKSESAGLGLAMAVDPWFGVPTSVDNLNPNDRRPYEKHLLIDGAQPGNNAGVQIINILRFIVQSTDGWWFRFAPLRENKSMKMQWSITTVNPSVMDLAPELSAPRNVTTQYEEHSAQLLRFSKGWSMTLDRLQSPAGQREMMLHIANLGSIAITTAKFRVMAAVLKGKYYWQCFNVVYGPALATPTRRELETAADRLFGAAATNEKFLYQVHAYAKAIGRSEGGVGGPSDFDNVVVPFGTMDLLAMTNNFELERDRRGPQAESRLRTAGVALMRYFEDWTMWEDSDWSNIMPNAAELLVNRRMVGRYFGIFPSDHAPYINGKGLYDANSALSYRYHDMDLAQDGKRVQYMSEALLKCGRFNSQGGLNEHHDELAAALNSRSMPAGIPAAWRESGIDRADPFLYNEGGWWKVVRYIGDMDAIAFPATLQTKMSAQIVYNQLDVGGFTHEDVANVNQLVALVDELASPHALALVTAMLAETPAAGALDATFAAPDEGKAYGFTTLVALRKLAASKNTDAQVARDGIHSLTRVVRALRAVFIDHTDNSAGAANDTIRSNPFMDAANVSVSVENETEDALATLLENIATEPKLPLFTPPQRRPVDQAEAGRFTAGARLGYAGDEIASIDALLNSEAFRLNHAAVCAIDALFDDDNTLDIKKLVIELEAGLERDVFSADNDAENSRILATLVTRPNTLSLDDTWAAIAAISLLDAPSGGQPQTFTALQPAVGADGWTRTRLALNPATLRGGDAALRLGSPSRVVVSIDGADPELANFEKRRASRTWFENTSVVRARCGDDAFVPSVNMRARLELIGARSANTVARIVDVLLLTSPLTRPQILALIDSSRGNTLPPIGLLHDNAFAVFDMGGMLLFKRSEETAQTQYNFRHVSNAYNSNKKSIQGHATMWLESQAFDPRRWMIILDVFYKRYITGLSAVVFESPAQYRKMTASIKFLLQPQIGQPSGFFFVVGGSTNWSTLPCSIYLNGEFNALEFWNMDGDSSDTPAPSHDSALFYSLMYGFHALNARNEASAEYYFDAKTSYILNSRSEPGALSLFDPHTSDWTRFRPGRGRLPAYELDRMGDVFSGRKMTPEHRGAIVSPLNF